MHQKYWDKMVSHVMVAKPASQFGHAVQMFRLYSHGNDQFPKEMNNDSDLKFS